MHQNIYYVLTSFILVACVKYILFAEQTRPTSLYSCRRNDVIGEFIIPANIIKRGNIVLFEFQENTAKHNNIVAIVHSQALARVIELINILFVFG